MKRLIGLLIFLLIIYVGSLAQNCTSYFPSTKGVEMETQYFDAKDALMSVSRYTVLDVEELSDGIKIKTHLRVEPQGKGESFEDDFDFYCKGNTFYFDMKQYMKDMQMDQYEDMDVNVTTEDLAFPAQMNPGDILKDASITISVSSGGMRLMNMVVSITDWKVEGMESVTTPAGVFECAKVSYNVATKSMFTITMKSVAWYASGIGAVRTEDYHEKGTLAGYSILTRFSQ